MPLEQAYALCIEPGDTVFDVGANVGQTAEVLARLVGPHGRCVSFECHPKMFEQLAAFALALPHSNLYPVCCALGDLPGQATLYAGTQSETSQASTLVRELANSSRLGAGMIQYEVRVDTLDAYIAASGWVPSFVKIDVEGAENRVFGGAGQLLERHRPKLVFEFGHEVTPCRLPAHFARLHSLGYAFFLVDLFHFRGVNLEPGEKIEWQGQIVEAREMQLNLLEAALQELQEASPIGGNLLAVHREQLAGLRSKFDKRFRKKTKSRIDRIFKIFQ